MLGSHHMMATKYILVSLPLGIFDSHDKNEALSSLSAVISVDNAITQPFPIPDFKIGTLDTLVQQADDLAKLDASCASVVAKVAESLHDILAGDEDKIQQQKMVNDSKQLATLVRLRHRDIVPYNPQRLTLPVPEPTDHYLHTFSWNKVRYRADKPLGELVEMLQKVSFPPLQLSPVLRTFRPNLSLQELITIDNDVKGKMNQHTSIKNNLASLQRRQT